MLLSTTLLELACMADAVLAGTHELTPEGLGAAMARLLELDASVTAVRCAAVLDRPADGNVVPFRRPTGGGHGEP